jgi:hypothetical protein
VWAYTRTAVDGALVLEHRGHLSGLILQQRCRPRLCALLRLRSRADAKPKCPSSAQHTGPPPAPPRGRDMRSSSNFAFVLYWTSAHPYPQTTPLPTPAQLRGDVQHGRPKIENKKRKTGKTHLFIMFFFCSIKLQNSYPPESNFAAGREQPALW